MNKLITNQTPYYTLPQESMLDFPNEELVEALNLEYTDQMQRQLITKVAVKASLMHKSQLTETITDEVIETHKIIGIEPHQKYLIVDIENTTNDKVFQVKVDLYNEPPFFCKLTLNDGSVVKLKGSGELTSTMTRKYKSTVINAEIGELCTSIGASAFQGCSGLTSVTIPNSVTSIGGGAFSHSGLTSVTIPVSVTSIGQGVFQDCSGLTSVTIPNSVTSIDDAAFGYCSSLTNISIPNSVTSIGNGAFQGCSSLTSITIPSSVTSIGGAAFGNCSSLTNITSLATTAPTITSYTFNNTVKTNGTLTVPSGSSGYDVWMGTGDYYLGKYGWTKVEQ